MGWEILGHKRWSHSVGALSTVCAEKLVFHVAPAGFIYLTNNCDAPLLGATQCLEAGDAAGNKAGGSPAS